MAAVGDCEPLAAVAPVEVLDAPPDARSFFERYVVTCTPVLMRGAADAWPARQPGGARAWTAERLRAAHGDAIVAVAPLPTVGAHARYDKSIEPANAWREAAPAETRHAAPAAAPASAAAAAAAGGDDHTAAAAGAAAGAVRADAVLAVAAERVPIRLATLLDVLADDAAALEAGAHGRGVTFYADGAANLGRHFDFLAADVCPPACGALLKPRRAAEAGAEASLWFGGATVSRCHYDNTDNLFTQVAGTKTFALVPPRAAEAARPGALRKVYAVWQPPSGPAEAAAAREEGARFSRRGADGARFSDEQVLNYWPEHLQLRVCAAAARAAAARAAAARAEGGATGDGGVGVGWARAAPDAADELVVTDPHAAALALATPAPHDAPPSAAPSPFLLAGRARGGARLPCALVSVRPGETLYLPFGWWHEVWGRPTSAAEGGLCASVSHFYAPFYCRARAPADGRIGAVRVNPRYSLLARAAAAGALGAAAAAARRRRDAAAAGGTRAPSHAPASSSASSSAEDEAAQSDSEEAEPCLPAGHVRDGATTDDDADDGDGPGPARPRAVQQAAAADARPGAAPARARPLMQQSSIVASSS